MQEKDLVDDSLSGSRRKKENRVDDGTLLDVTNPPVSGAFIALAKKGKLEVVSPLVTKHSKLSQRLRLVEGKLVACNIEKYVAEFVTYCRGRKLDFQVEFPKRVKKLETEKKKLKSKLAKSETRLQREGLFESVSAANRDSSPVPISFVPTRVVESNPFIRERNAVIEKYQDRSTRVICQKLDAELHRTIYRHLPENWVTEYKIKGFVEAYHHPECKPLVQKLISTAKQKFTSKTTTFE